MQAEIEDGGGDAGSAARHDGAVEVDPGRLEGLAICEAEAATREDIVAVAFPPWAAVEITADPFFAGGNLAVAEPAEVRRRAVEVLG